MRGTIKFQETKRALKLLLLFLTTSFYMSAQDYAVTPVSDLLNTYSQKYTDFSKEIESSELESSKKLFVVANKLSELKTTYKSERTAEYENKSVKRAKRLSCQGTRIRGVTQCEPVLIKAPNTNMYTKDEWITIEGSDNITVQLLDDSSVSLKKTATGTRLNKSTVYVIYKYKEELISGLVDKEVTELFNMIIENNSL